MVAIVAGLGCVGAAQAEKRAVGPDGNLWSVDWKGKVVRFDAAGNSTVFNIPGNALGEAITSGPSDGLTIVTRPTSDLTGPTKVRGISTSGTFEGDGLQLESVFDQAEPYAERGLDIGPGGTIWVTQGWKACRNGVDGNLISMDSSGGTTARYGALAPYGQEGAYPEGPVAVDGAGRAWVYGFVPKDEECDDSTGWTGWSGYHQTVLIDGDQLLRTDCGGSWEGGAVVASDGAAWCFGNRKLFRMNDAGDITEFDYPAEWSDPEHLRAGPDGSLWFAAHTGFSSGNVYSQDWTVASVSGQGALTTYPGFDDTLTENTYSGGYVALYDWRFTGQGKIWLVKNLDLPGGILAGVVDVPTGQSQGLLPGRETTFIQNEPPVDPPIVKPRDEPLRLLVRRPPKLPLKKLRRTRSIPLTVWASKPAEMTVELSVPDRFARKVGLRGKKDKRRTLVPLAWQDLGEVEGEWNIEIVVPPKKAKKLAKLPTRIWIQLYATSGVENASFGQAIVTKR